MTSIPTENTINARWLTERLNEAGHAVIVTGFTAKRIGTGQIGKCIRYALDLTGETEGAPKSLVGKFPSDDEVSRATGVMLKNFIKEVSFYQQLQERLTIATPKCYFAAIDGEGPDFALLLEDLSPAVQGDQLAGCSVDVARASVLELVGLHAPSWNDETLRGKDWLGEPDAESTALNRALYQGNIDGFADRYGPNLKEDELAIIREVAGAEPPMGDMLPTPFSLVHIDYRLDNLLIDETSSPPKITAVDWQSISLGSPLADVAYFLGAGLRSETRRQVEEKIVRAYHSALQGAGIKDYGWEACWTDYRKGVFAGFFVTVIASMIVERTERGDEMFLTMARRHARHAIDLNCDVFLA
jgi:hypothetical protein